MNLRQKWDFTPANVAIIVTVLGSILTTVFLFGTWKGAVDLRLKVLDQKVFACCGP